MSKPLIDFQLAGGKELQKALDELPQYLSNRVLKQALTDAAEPILTHAKYLVPVDRGDLKESLKIGATLSRRQRRIFGKAGGVTVYVGASSPKGAHAHLLEFGTSKTEPQPFLRPAWDGNKRKALKIFTTRIWDRLRKAAKTLRRKAEKRTLGKSARRALS